jgi:enterochelin esterase family protein
MSFDELLFQLENATSVAAKTRLVREFANAHSSPLIEDTRATFFYLSEDAQTVALEGDWTHWAPTAHLEYLPDTPLWYRVERFPRAARLEYRVVVNGRARLDPRNPRVAPLGFGPNSEIAMPDYRAPREWTDAPPARRGTLEQHWMMSDALNERQTFWVCLPPRYAPPLEYPVAYFNDGDGYLHFAEVPRVMDDWIERGEIKPFIAVLIKPNNREKEYARNNQYVRFLTNELVPWLDDNYPTRAEPAARAIIGASFGGLLAAHAARRRPNVFGLVGGQSGFYSYHNDALLRDYAAAQNLGIRFHLTVGEFETDWRGNGKPEDDLVAAQRRFVELLRGKGYAVECAEYPEGHQWGFWRAHVGEMLKFFWK